MYRDAYMRSLEDPEKFWDEIGSQSVSWDRLYDKVLDNDSEPFTKWFCGGYLNACYNCIDRHVLSGKGDKIAIIHDSPVTNTVRKVSYKELLDTVTHIIARKVIHIVN
jgi:propionyl-CoA synthetase